MNINVDLNVNFGMTPTAEAFVMKLLTSTSLRAPAAFVSSADKPARGSVEFAVEPAKAAEEAPAPKPRGRPRKDAAPVAPPTSEPEAEAQDAVDEAEESAAKAPAAEESVEVFTRDSIRKELGN